MKTLGTHNYYVYVLTNNLKERLFQHKNPLPFSKSFTAKYKCFFLIYFENFNSIETAIKREKQIKGITQLKKEEIINEFNPKWKFLNNNI